VYQHTFLNINVENVNKTVWAAGRKIMEKSWKIIRNGEVMAYLYVLLWLLPEVEGTERV